MKIGLSYFPYTVTIACSWCCFFFLATSTDTTPSDVNFRALSSHRQWLVLIIILIAPFMSYVDVYIVFVASPSIQHGLQASFEQIQFVIAGYTIAYGVNLITAGRLGDTYGRKRMFMIGMAVFTIASL